MSLKGGLMRKLLISGVLFCFLVCLFGCESIFPREDLVFKFKDGDTVVKASKVNDVFVFFGFEGKTLEVKSVVFKQADRKRLAALWGPPSFHQTEFEDGKYVVYLYWWDKQLNSVTLAFYDDSLANFSFSKSGLYEE